MPQNDAVRKGTSQVPTWLVVLGYSALGAMAALAVRWSLRVGASWLSTVTIVVVAVALALGNRRLFRTAVTRDGDAIVCRFVPWFEGDFYRLIALLPVVGTWASVTAFTGHTAGLLGAIGFPLLAAIPLTAFAIVRMWRSAMLRITPHALFVRTPGHGAAVTEIPRKTVRSVEPELVPRSKSAPTWRVAVVHQPVESGEETLKTLPIGSIQWDCPLWLTAGRIDLLEALQEWKDNPGNHPEPLMDRIETILVRRTRPETKPPYVPPPPLTARPPEAAARTGPTAGVAVSPAAAYEYPPLESAIAEPAEPAAPPRVKLPWWGRVLVAVIGLIFLIGWRAEDASVARLTPPSNAWFSSGQTVTVALTAGQPKTVYWRVQNARSKVRATAECQAVDLQSGTDIELTKVRGDLRVGTMDALVNVNPSRTGSVALTCFSKGARTSAFAVGQEVPRPRLLNGVANYSGSHTGMWLVGMVFLAPALLIVGIAPVKPVVKVWVFRFWAPLLIAALFTLTMSSMWDGFIFGLLWYGIGWFRWREKRRKPDQDNASQRSA